MELATEFQGVRSHHLRKCVTQVQRVVNLGFIGDGNAHYEGRKNHVFHAFKLRSLDRESPCRGVGREALCRLAYAEAALGLPNYIGVAEIARVDLIDRAAAENLRVS